MNLLLLLLLFFFFLGGGGGPRRRDPASRQLDFLGPTKQQQKGTRQEDEIWHLVISSDKARKQDMASRQFDLLVPRRLDAEFLDLCQVDVLHSRR